MSNVYSLADLRADLDKEFAPVEIDLGRGKVVLRNVLRLNAEDRKKVMEASKLLTQDKDGDIEELFEGIRTVIRLVAADGKGDALVNAIGDDLALGMKIMTIWTEATQPGEASNSPA